MNEMITILNTLVNNSQIMQWILADEPRSYGWHNAHFPPEYRRACLSGKSCNPDIYTETYYLMSRLYEEISGEKAPYDFRVFRKWKDHLRSSPKSNEFTELELNSIIQAIEIGTRRKREARDPAAVMDLLKHVISGLTSFLET